VIIGDMREKQMAKICRQGVAMVRKAEARGRAAKLIGLDRWRELVEFRARLDEWPWLI